MKKIILGALVSIIPTQALSAARRKWTDVEAYTKLPGENQVIKVGSKYIVPRMVGGNIFDKYDPIFGRLNEFSIKVISRVKDSRPKGQILSQSPTANEKVDRPMTISVTISEGS